jgi:CBS domain-containing protein
MIEEVIGQGDEGYFEGESHIRGHFDVKLLRSPVSSLPVRPSIVLSSNSSVTDAVRAMQKQHRGCVLVTDDGTRDSKLVGIFTERDVLFRIVDKGRNPASLQLSEVMTADPEVLSTRSSVAYVLNKMSVGGFRHVPVVDDNHCPAFVVAVRDVVEFLVESFPREILTLSDDFNSDHIHREGA